MATASPHTTASASVSTVGGGRPTARAAAMTAVATATPSNAPKTAHVRPASSVLHMRITSDARHNRGQTTALASKVSRRVGNAHAQNTTAHHPRRHERTTHGQARYQHTPPHSQQPTIHAALREPCVTCGHRRTRRPAWLGPDPWSPWRCALVPVITAGCVRAARARWKQRGPNGGTSCRGNKGKLLIYRRSRVSCHTNAPGAAG